MPASASKLKEQGNAAFANKQYRKAVSSYGKAIELEKDDSALAALLSNRSAAYVFLNEFDKALADANLACQRRPKWSKAYVRAAEVHARLQDFSTSIQTYEYAITLAEDEPTKKRYQASLETTRQASARAMKSSHATECKLFSAKSADAHWSATYERAVADGFQLDPFSGLAITVNAFESGQTGFKTLENAYRRKMPNGAIEAGFSSLASTEIAECVLIDESAFVIPASKNTDFPLAEKFNMMLQCEIQYHGCVKYFTRSIWSAKDIVADLDERLQEEGRERIRRTCSQLVRQQILSAFTLSTRGESGTAVASLKLALGILTEGNAKWPDVPYEEKGACFRPTYTRLVKTYLLNVLLRAARDAKSPSARRQWSLESVETLAKELIAENPENEWPSIFQSTPVNLVCYYVKPKWEALSALAFVAGHHAQLPLLNLPLAKLAFADVKYAKEAAEYYDAAAAMMQDDWHQKAQHLWYALQSHLRAGGLTVDEVYSRAAEADRIAQLAARFFPMVVDDKNDIREFCMCQVDAIKQTVAAMPPSRAATATSETLKAIPTYRMRPNTSPSVIQNDPLWTAHPNGTVQVVDVFFPN